MRRTAGVTHITVFTKPDVCGGNCLYCPKVPGLPKSYLPHSNIARHGLSYSAREQVEHWIGDNAERGGVGSKLEILILGGSFTAHAIEYQEEFLRGIYQAVDGTSGPLEELVHAHHLGSGRRIIGITIESRPNQITREVVARLFAAGVTKIELGAQSLDDEVLAFNERGHTVSELARATAIIKGFGLKVGYHVLFGLPGASLDSDLATANSVFTDPRFQPDHLKIYICEMFKREFMRERLVALFDSGEWRPLDRERRLDLFAQVLPRVPRFMRISRIGRKVAGDELEGENLKMPRSDIEKQFKCRCVRCREPLPKRPVKKDEIVIRTEALNEDEMFLEAGPASDDACFGLLRLHLSADEAVIRELHVYGLETAPGDEGRHQHHGIGKRLVRAAEEAAEARDIKSIAVASGVGVRQYYERQGYALGREELMWKKLA